MVLDVSNSPGLLAKTGRAAHGRRGRSLTAGTARPTPLTSHGMMVASLSRPLGY